MLYTAAEIILFLIASAVLGVLVGYFSWGRRASGDSTEVLTLQRQLAATRKRAAAAEAEVTKHGEALNKAKMHFDDQQTRIEQLESHESPPRPISEDEPKNYEA